jgi:dihydroorotate dehydrogenase (NAD+) catalytic subunit
MADIRTNIAGLEMKNPVMTASGTFGYGIEFADLVNLEEIGGIIVKGTTLHPREGNDYPRMAETACGMLNCVGLQNKGVDYFCKHIYPEIKDLKTNVIVNVSGSSPEDYAECARRIDELENIPAIELNISCPNVKATVSCNVQAPLLLGNEVLDRVATITIDNTNQTLKFNLK